MASAGTRSGLTTASRREVFAFAAVLAATAITGAAAIAGLRRTPPAAPSSPPTVQVTQTVPAASPRVEPGG